MQTQADPWRRELAPICGLLVLVGVYFAVLEITKPNYFLWDDNASFYLPCYAYNGWALFDEGALAHVNYHQYLGHTYLGSGQTGVLYPPVYLALGVSQWIWGDLRATIDLLAVLHLALAAVGMYALLRRLALSRTVSLLTAFLWMSFPFLVQVAANWIFVSYAAALLPWSLLLLDRLLAAPSAGRMLALAAVKALFFYQGYVQYAVLATLFEGCYIAVRWGLDRSSRAGWRRAVGHYLLALAAGGVLAAPLLLPMLHAKQLSAYRTGSLSFAEFLSNALSLRTFLLAQGFRMEPRAIHLATGSLFFVGIPNLVAVGALVVSRRRRRRGAGRFLFCAVVAASALVLSTRAYGMMYFVPLLSSFRWPFKSFLIFLFFLAIAAAGAYESAWLDRRRWVRRLGLVLLLSGIVANVTIVMVPAFDIPFGPNRIDKDVKEIRREIAGFFPLEQGRVVSLWLSPLEPRIYRLLVFNYATLAGAYHLGGYDPLIARENLELAVNLEYSNIFRYELTQEALDYLSSWSVRFLMVPEREEFHRIFAGFPQLRRSYRGHGIEVYENAAALPFAYFQGSEITPVPVDWEINGLRIPTAGRSGLLRIGVAPLRWYVWSVDGREMGQVSYDEQRHVLIEVPPGAREVRVRYVDVPFLLGVGVFLAFVLAAASTWGLRRFRRRSSD
ncbi:MAG: hypothetical protein GY856_04385 [bacterium]|nr:hypothetical protein [bacterium]